MTNFAKSRAEIEATQGDLIAVPKAQLLHLLDKAEIGQNAERHLNFVRTIATLGIDGPKAAA